MRSVLAIAVSTFLLNACAVGPATYSAGPTRGTVVDAKTHEPVGGAIVIALWDLQGGMERGTVGTFKVFESTTNAAGRFDIPGWGPELARISGYLDRYDPHVIVFKPGYVPRGFTNGPFVAPSDREHQSQHNWLPRGGPLEVMPTDEPLSRFMDRVEWLSGNLHNVIYNGNGCDWKRIPRTIRLLEEMEKRAISQGISPQYHLSAKELMDRKHCAPFEQFLHEYSEMN